MTLQQLFGSGLPFRLALPVEGRLAFTCELLFVLATHDSPQPNTRRHLVAVDEPIQKLISKGVEVGGCRLS